MIKLHKDSTSDLGKRLVRPLENWLNERWTTRAFFDQVKDKMWEYKRAINTQLEEINKLKKEINKLAPRIKSDGFYDFRGGIEFDEALMHRTITMELCPIKIKHQIQVIGYNNLHECEYAIKVMKDELQKEVWKEVGYLVDEAMEQYKGKADE